MLTALESAREALSTLHLFIYLLGKVLVLELLPRQLLDQPWLFGVMLLGAVDSALRRAISTKHQGIGSTRR